MNARQTARSGKRRVRHPPFAVLLLALRIRRNLSWLAIQRPLLMDLKRVRRVWLNLAARRSGGARLLILMLYFFSI